MKKLLLITMIACTISICNTVYAMSTKQASTTIHGVEYVLLHADSTRTLNIGGLSLSVMDFAQTSVTINPRQVDHIHDAEGKIVRFGLSPRMKLFNFPPHSRQKLVITDDDYYDYRGHYELSGITYDPIDDWRDFSSWNILLTVDSDLKFDFDLSEYECDWDVYIVFINAERVLDNAFRNFKLSDNIKSISLYCGGEFMGVGHNAFTSIPRFDVVDVTNIRNVWGPASPHLFFHDIDWYGFHPSFATDLYADSFSNETYDNTPLLSTITQSEYNHSCEILGYDNNWYTYFKNNPLGVEDIAVDERPVEYTVQGNTVVLTNLASNQPVEVYTVSGATVGRYRADDAGSLNIDIARSGFYLLKINDKCIKVVIRL